MGKPNLDRLPTAVSTALHLTSILVCCLMLQLDQEELGLILQLADVDGDGKISVQVRCMPAQHQNSSHNRAATDSR
jgi:hypothetical protein